MAGWLGAMHARMHIDHAHPRVRMQVVGVTPHPSRRYFVSGSSDASWSFYDLETTTCLKQVGAEEGPAEPYTTLQFHPDGLILGTATEAKVIR